MKRRQFILAVAAGIATSGLYNSGPAPITGEESLTLARKFQRYMVALNWKRNQDRINFVVNGICPADRVLLEGTLALTAAPKLSACIFEKVAEHPQAQFLKTYLKNHETAGIYRVQWYPLKTALANLAEVPAPCLIDGGNGNIMAIGGTRS